MERLRELTVLQKGILLVMLVMVIVFSVIYPTATVIYGLLTEPKVTHKGEGFAWFGGVLICLINTVMILFADALFRFQMSFRVREIDTVEPSEFELLGRYIAWFMLTLIAFAVFMIGLR